MESFSTLLAIYARNNREAGDLRCHRTHYDINVMNYCYKATMVTLYKSFLFFII